MRKCVLTVALLALTCPQAPAWGQAVSLEIPSITVGPAGGIVTIPVLLSSVELVPGVQFTIDYDHNVATYQSVALGADLNTSAWITLQNPSPPVGSASPGTNASVIITVAGGGAAGRVSGSNLELARVTFALAAGVCDASPLTFDRACQFTQVDAAGQTVCFPELGLKSGQVATTCATNVPPSISGAFHLLQNQPNPFNPSTSIGFMTPGSSHVHLIVVDALGRTVRRLVNAILPGGWHVVSWNGCDDSGIKAASGMYYYRLTSGDEVQTRQMLLLK